MTITDAALIAGTIFMGGFIGIVAANLVAIYLNRRKRPRQKS